MICNHSIVEMNYPTSTKTYLNYVKYGKPTEKSNIQMQMQMYLTGLKTVYFHAADINYKINKNVEVISLTLNDSHMPNFLKLLVGQRQEIVYTVF